MSIKLSELKREEIRKTIPTGDIDYPIEIYNPTKEQKLKILETLKGNMEIKNDEAVSKISDRQFLLELLGELTNIYIDWKDERNINEAIEDPSEILIKVNIEINDICDEIFNAWYASFKSTNNLPEEVKKVMYDKMLENEMNPENEKQKKIEELQKQLAELKGE